MKNSSQFQSPQHSAAEEGLEVSTAQLSRLHDSLIEPA